MLREVFKQYIKVSRGVSDRTLGHYITGINSINTILAKNGFQVTDVFSVKTLEELDAMKEFLAHNEEFIAKDSIGHNMYSVAFRHFYRFACEDGQFFSKSIQQMDIPLEAPQLVQSSTQAWKRNLIIKEQAIQGANFMCENDNGHRTFTSKATGKQYMEGHHLIPIRFQAEFGNSLDVYANVVCLCPNCHRLLHYGKDSEKIYTAEKLFDFRCERLIKCGIDLSKKEFTQIII